MASKTPEIPIRDIHLPGDISWWPPALGWWIILGIILCIVALLILRKAKQHKKRLQKKSMQAFYRLKVDYHLNKDTYRIIEELSVLLRRIALSYYDREEIASLSGEKWLKKLDQLSNEESITFLSEAGRKLITAPYQKDPNIDLSELLKLTEDWIKALPASKPDFVKVQPK